MDAATVKGETASLVAAKSPLVAVVDDDDLFRGYLSVLLKDANCQVFEAACGQELMDLLARQEIDCVLLDYHLAAENGLSIHEQIKEQFRAAPPIVMLTRESSERTIIKAFRGGVSDYVLKKGFTSEELFKAVNAALVRRAEDNAHRAEILRLKRKSEFDDATGLYSRQSIDERLARVMNSQRTGRCAVVLIAVDRLEGIADKFGQVIADRARRAFVSRLKRALGPSEIGGCYDEGRFIALTDVDVRFKTVGLTCARLARELSFDVNLDAVGFAIKARIGAAIYPVHGTTAADVLASAERALNESKSGGMPFVVAPEPAADAVAVPSMERSADPASVDGNRQEPSSRFGAVAPVTRQGDRRSVPRQRVFKRGQIVIANLQSTIECTVRDISPKGARLRVEGHFIAPERFELVLLSSQERKPVLTRWQTGNEIGVQFAE